MFKEYYHQTVKSTIASLNSSIKGLSINEIKKRQAKYGLNKLAESKPVSKLKIFFSQFNSLLIYILIFAAGISFLFKQYIDGAVILGAVILNTIIGYFQENKANNNLNKLKTYIKRQVFVRRDNKQYLIPAENLVPGDIILLQAGSRVSADARIIKANELEVNESILTGEALAVTKSNVKNKIGTIIADRRAMLYAGTTIIKGNAEAIVTAIGMQTEIGQIANYVSQTNDEQTPLQLRLKKLTKIIGLVSLLICFLILVLGVILGRTVLEMFLISVAIAVSSIPEGLPVAITVVLAIGMQRILKKKSLVRRLVAAETLGSTTVICTDKTGTLTLGKMKVSNIIVNNKIISLLNKRNQELSDKVKEVLRVGLLCNNAFFEDQEKINLPLTEWKVSGSPTDQALLISAVELGIPLVQELKKYPKIGEVVFDSAKKYMLTLHSQDNKKELLLLAKGAPEVLLKECSFISTERGLKKNNSKNLEQTQKIINKLTAQGLRLLVVAKKNISSKLLTDDLDDNFKDLTFLGLIALKDPLRKDAQQTIKTCLGAGIRPIIITGDHQLTAKAIAKELGLKVAKENILNGEELNNLSDDDLQSKVKQVNLYARVSPHHKLRIIKALQKNKEVVAMVGDGINDAPAIQMADIGIALGSGTDIAQETAEIVLLDNSFSVIIEAIKQGRILFDNLKKIIVYLMSDSFSGMLLVSIAILLGFPLPLIPAQILWINIVNDALPNFALAFEKGDSDIMKRRPILRGTSLLDKEMKFLIFVIGVFTDLGIIVLFIYLLKSGHDINHIRTYMFAALGIDSLIYVYSCKNLKRQIWNYKLFDNKFLVLGTIISFIMLIAGIYFPLFQKILRTVPLGVEGWLIMLGVSFFEIISIEFGKWLFIHRRNK